MAHDRGRRIRQVHSGRFVEMSRPVITTMSTIYFTESSLSKKLEGLMYYGIQPCQVQRSSPSTNPEWALSYSLLEGALLDLFSEDMSIQRDAREWLLGAPAAISAHHVCAILGIDSDLVALAVQQGKVHKPRRSPHRSGLVRGKRI